MPLRRTAHVHASARHPSEGTACFCMACFCKALLMCVVVHLQPLCVALARPTINAQTYNMLFYFITTISSAKAIIYRKAAQPCAPHGHGHGTPYVFNCAFFFLFIKGAVRTTNDICRRPPHLIPFTAGFIDTT
eukprot:1158067-Pelagomonas_calceolata.AAC.15